MTVCAATQADRIARDAEALLTVIAPADFPAGVVLLPLNRADASGGCLGSGHALALANGCRPGAVALWVDAAAFVHGFLAALPDEPDVGLDSARVLVEEVALHEAAHALTSRLDGVGGADDATAFVQAAEARPWRHLRPDDHGPAWAAAAVVLHGRAVRRRPARERAARDAAIRDDVECYGFDFAAIADAVGSVPDVASLRELLSPGSDVMRRVAAVCRPEAERATFIEHRRRQRVAGEGIAVSS
jgi:hypothetical protein